MSLIPGVNVAAPVVPFDTTDVHPSHEARYGKGGYRTVATTAERDAIPAARREAGMLVFITADAATWRLESDLTTWSASSADSLDAVADVEFANLSDGDLLRFSTGRWRNYPQNTLLDAGNF